MWAVQVDGSSVVDDNDLLIITSDSDGDGSESPTRNTSDVAATRDEIPDVWDGFDEGGADAFVYEQNPVVSPPVVSKHLV